MFAFTTARVGRLWFLAHARPAVLGSLAEVRWDRRADAHLFRVLYEDITEARKGGYRGGEGQRRLCPWWVEAGHPSLRRRLVP